MTTDGDQTQDRAADPVQRRRRKRLAALKSAERQVPVNFSIVGVQKAATSTLYMMLARHRLVARGPEKEMRVFMMEDIDWERPDFSDYRRPTSKAHARLAGDATPEYLFWPRALERMHRYDASMPLIGTFRDPIERAFSQWSMQRMRDPAFPDLPDAIAQWAEPRIPDDIPDGLPPFELRRRSLFTRGLYGQQVERGLAIFPPERWLMLDFRDVTGRPNQTLDQVTDHLGIDRFRSYPEPLHRNQTPTDHVGAAPSVADIERLVQIYADDLPRFGQLSGIDVSRWSTGKVLAGELDVRDLRDTLTRKLGLPV